MLLFKIIINKHRLYIKLHLNVCTFRFKEGRTVNFEDCHNPVFLCSPPLESPQPEKDEHPCVKCGTYACI